ncbi:MAG: hypothetical protein IMY77_02635 [Chloroflexi bacterium]|nr:hypothetical protein [Chloroflexota bacterium]
MIDFNSEEDIKRLLKSVYKSGAPSPELKERLLESLTLEAGGAALNTSYPLWKRPRLWLPIAVAVISGVIGYGVWLSLNVVPTLLP